MSALSDTARVESCVTGELTEMGNKKKPILAPKKILKKPKHNKKGALLKRCNPPTGRVGGSPLTRLLPDICNGKTSTEVCYERAVAFSQRQMQDIESIAVKLMTELKSMKDIVEEKVLHEAYRCTSMKNDADEVCKARNILAAYLAIFSCLYTFCLLDAAYRLISEHDSDML